MQLLVIDDSSIWDDFVDRSPYGTLFHKWGFLKTIEKHTGYTLLPYGMYSDDKLICIFPAFLRANYGLNVVLSPPPRTGVPYMGFALGSDHDELTQNGKEVRLREIVKLITEKLEEISPAYVSFQLTPFLDDIREFKWNDYSVDPLFTYYLPTDALLDDIFSGFSRSTRNLLNKIRKNKFNMEMKESNDIALFSDMLSKRYEEQGIRFPITNMDYLTDLLRLYPDNIKLYYVYDENGNIIGSSIVIIFKDKVISWLGTPKPDVDLPVNELLFWELVKIAKETGRMFEIGGADTQRLCSFKSRFNPSLETNYRVFRRRNIGVVAEWVYLNLYKKSSSFR